jgi:hypothetical protein
LEESDSLLNLESQDDRPSLDKRAVLTLFYRPSHLDLARQIVWLLSPVWLGWSLYVIAQSFFSSGLSLFASGFSLTIAFYFFLIAFVFFFLKVVLQEKFLLCARDGLLLPPHLFLAARGKLRRSWIELKEVDFQAPEGDYAHPRIMTLLFSDGASVDLQLSGLKKEALRDLLLAIQYFADHVVFRPQLSRIDLNLDMAFSTLGLHPSYTQLWEESLVNRYGSTTFVPLACGSKLRQGAIVVKGQLSFGGLSAIYLADNGERLLVVKEAVLPQMVAEDTRQKALELFEREARILSGLKHPQIVEVLDYFIENQRHYLVLVYVEGQDLRRFVLEQGAQSFAHVKRWFKEMLEILVYLHEMEPPVIHRDVSPDNFMLGRDGKIVLIDFGAANYFIGTVTGTMIGKQHYIAPEQFRGHATVQSDIYALAGTVFFLLTSQDPEPLHEVDLRACQTFIRASLASEEEFAKWTQVLAQASKFELTERYSSARIFLQAVEEL